MAVTKKRTEVRYAIKQSPLTKKCKIYKLTFEKGTQNLLKRQVSYKNKTLTEAQEIKYFLDRGMKPIV